MIWPIKVEIFWEGHTNRKIFHLLPLLSTYLVLTLKSKLNICMNFRASFISHFWFLVIVFILRKNRISWKIPVVVSELFVGSGFTKSKRTQQHGKKNLEKLRLKLTLHWGWLPTKIKFTFQTSLDKNIQKLFPMK